MDSARRTRRARRVLAAVAGTWTARAYLVLCGALLVWVLADAALVTREDASFAGIFPLLATAPLSVLFLLLAPGEGLLVYLPVVIVCAVANAALINWCVRAAGRGGRSPGGAP
jgi:hypothetical protein